MPERRFRIDSRSQRGVTIPKRVVPNNPEGLNGTLLPGVTLDDSVNQDR
jgi:hypothetical protein